MFCHDFQNSYALSDFFEKHRDESIQVRRLDFCTMIEQISYMWFNQIGKQGGARMTLPNSVSWIQKFQKKQDAILRCTKQPVTLVRGTSRGLWGATWPRRFHQIGSSHIQCDTCNGCSCTEYPPSGKLSVKGISENSKNSSRMRQWKHYHSCYQTKPNKSIVDVCFSER
jgi:hypothetical protein